MKLKEAECRKSKGAAMSKEKECWLKNDSRERTPEEKESWKRKVLKVERRLSFKNDKRRILEKKGYWKKSEAGYFRKEDSRGRGRMNTL